MYVWKATSSPLIQELEARSSKIGIFHTLQHYHVTLVMNPADNWAQVLYKSAARMADPDPPNDIVIGLNP